MLTFGLLTTCLCGMWKRVSVCCEVEHLCEVKFSHPQKVSGRDVSMFPGRQTHRMQCHGDSCRSLAAFYDPSALLGRGRTFQGV